MTCALPRGRMLVKATGELRPLRALLLDGASRRVAAPPLCGPTCRVAGFTPLTLQLFARRYTGSVACAAETALWAE